MKSYPSISSKIIYNTPVYVFDKLDGSNIRAEWTKKRGFHKFGRRNGLLDDSNPILKKSIPLFEDKYSNDLDKIFRQQGWDKAVAYVEFYGDRSFAGLHHEDDDHDVTLFDVWVHKKGFVSPRDFISLFEDLGIPNFIFYGNINGSVENRIRNSLIEGITFEGVVCKNDVVFKIKTHAWLDRLRSMCTSEEFKKLK
jgi:hypothetical protein